MASAATQIEYRYSAFCFTCAPNRDFTASLVLQNYTFNTKIALSNIVSFSVDGKNLLNQMVIQQYLADEQAVSDRQAAVDLAKISAMNAQGLVAGKKALLQVAEARRDAAKSLLDSLSKQISQSQNDLKINQQQIAQKMAAIAVAQAAGAPPAAIQAYSSNCRGFCWSRAT